jgi:hypothetical protein
MAFVSLYLPHLFFSYKVNQCTAGFRHQNANFSVHSKPEIHLLSWRKKLVAYPLRNEQQTCTYIRE